MTGPAMAKTGEKTTRLVPRLVLILTIYAPDGSEHKHARLPNGTELDTVLDELIAKYGDGNEPEYLRAKASVA